MRSGRPAWIADAIASPIKNTLNINAIALALSLTFSAGAMAQGQDATADKLEAEYKMAKEKCDTYSGSAQKLA
jgi:hypothetical protein